MIDYVLTAAVGISAGVGALVSAVPNLQPNTLSAFVWESWCVITVMNLRGVQRPAASSWCRHIYFIA